MEQNEVLEQFKEKKIELIDDFNKKLSTFRAGAISPQLVLGLKVECYGIKSPLNQCATVRASDAWTLIVQPYDVSTLSSIKKSIEKAQVAPSLSDDGSVIRLSFPPLSEERRLEVVKDISKVTEEKKVNIRCLRRECNDIIKKLVKDGLSEDLARDLENNIQKMTDSTIKEVETIFEKKKKDILTI